MDYNAVKAELAAGHLDTGLYDADNKVAADQLNASNRTRPVESVSGQQIFEAVDPEELALLSDRQERRLLGIVGMGTIWVNGTNTRATLLALFGPNTTTRDNLAALQTEPISRATELGLGDVREGTVQHAREM